LEQAALLVLVVVAQEAATVITRLLTQRQVPAAVAVHLRTHLQILVAVAVEAAHNRPWRLPVLPDKETTAELQQELTPAAEAVVQVLLETMLLLARLAALVVAEVFGRKILSGTPAAVVVVVNKRLA
jgi:hypothetical protein